MKNIEDRICELTKTEDEAIALREFIEFYRGFVLDEGKVMCIHPQDEEIIKKHNSLIFWDPIDAKENKDAKEYWNKLIESGCERKIFGNITPSPFCGNIIEAKVVCISANPGMGFSTYSDEIEDKCMYKEQESLLRNMCTTSNDYGFWPMDPKFEKSGGGQWWCYKQKQLLGLVKYLSEEIWHISFEDARKKFSNMFSNIEVFPYHSKKVDWKIARLLKAYEVNKNFIERYLYPRAIRNEIVLIKIWGKNEVLVGEEFPENGSYHVSPQNKGKYVVERLSPVINENQRAEYGINGMRIVKFLKNNNL